MKAATRNLWIELTAIGLILLSLLFLLVSAYHLSMFVVHSLLPDEPPFTFRDLVLGRNEFLVGIFATVVPATALAATAWALRVLLVDEREPDP